MKKQINKTIAFLTSNTAWIFLTLLLFFSYLFLLTVVDNNLGNYLVLFLKLSLFYSPVLLFAFFRNWLACRLNKWLVVLLWIGCFLLTPAIIQVLRIPLIDLLFGIDQYKHNEFDVYGEFSMSVFLTISGAVLATELAILFSTYFVQNSHQKKWIQKIDVDKMILGILFLLAIVSAVLGIIELEYKNDSTTGTFHLVGRLVSFTIQSFLMNLAIYFYYYINKYILIPKFLRLKGIIYYGFSVVAVILLFYPFFIFLIRFLPMVSDLNIGIYAYDNLFGQDGGGMPFLIMALSLPVIISNQWYRQNSQINNLEKEKSAAELNMLKQQINPHFFFNTLNNLYALSITKDEQTPEVIMQLSDLMRYVIYKGKEETVPLKEEIKYIEGYIQLQQIRLHKSLDFKFEIAIEDDSVPIPPLLFITFVENAFKHGIEPAEGDCFLHLYLKSNNNGLTFSCHNSIEEKSTTPSGIGLQNFKRRMQLRFPNKHQIQLDEKQNSFLATINITR